VVEFKMTLRGRGEVTVVVDTDSYPKVLVDSVWDDNGEKMDFEITNELSAEEVDLVYDAAVEKSVDSYAARLEDIADSVMYSMDTYMNLNSAF